MIEWKHLRSGNLRLQTGLNWNFLSSIQGTCTVLWSSWMVLGIWILLAMSSGRWTFSETGTEGFYITLYFGCTSAPRCLVPGTDTSKYSQLCTSWAWCAGEQTLAFHPGYDRRSRGFVSLVDRGLKIYPLYRYWGYVSGMAAYVNCELAWSCGFAAHNIPYR